MAEANQSLPETAEPIPLRIVIGVTGHRDLEAKAIDKIEESLNLIFDRICKMFPGTKYTEVKFACLSPLAEGADRLVAKTLLKYREDTLLKVVLPLEKSDYLKDFKTRESKVEFNDLFNKARFPVTLRGKSISDEYPPDMLDGARAQAYEDVGKFVVDHCDILIALWDGNGAKGKGGTGHIVEYARESQCPIFTLNTLAPEQVEFIEGKGIIQSMYKKIDKFNTNLVEKGPSENYVNNQYNSLFSTKKYPLAGNIEKLTKNLVKKYLIPYYVVASQQAKKFQRIYKNVGLSVFWMAFLSVFCISFGIIFLNSHPFIFLAESVILTLILVLIAYANRIHSHRNWLESRFFTERIRTSFFLTICGIEIPPVYINRRDVEETRSSTWMLPAFEEIVNRMPSGSGISWDNLEVLSQYVKSAWLGNQLLYHQGSADSRNERGALSSSGKGIINQNITMSETLEKMGSWVFYVALAVASIHFISHMLFQVSHHHPVSLTMTLFALTLPAVASAFESIRNHRQYRQLVIRSKKVSFALRNIERRFILLTPKKFEGLVKETEQVLLEEAEEWITLMSFSQLHKAV
jgi:hypothetical protein